MGTEVAMIITIQDAYDGFYVVINDKTFHFDQEDTREQLVEAFKLSNPSAKITYEILC